MKIFDAVVTPAQDNCAIRVFICRDDRKETGRLKEIIADEEENGINTHERSIRYRDEVRLSCNKLKEKLLELKNVGARKKAKKCWS